MQQFSAYDKSNQKIMIECGTIDPLSEEFFNNLSSLSTSLARAYTPVELEFVKQHPRSIAQDKFLHSLALHVAEGADRVDWPHVESLIEKNLEKFFSADFQKGLAANQEMSRSFSHHLLVAKEADRTVGALYCMMSNADAGKIVRVPIFAINPEAQSRGIGKILMGAVLKHIPDCKKIVLSTRITNNKALRAYQQWGFVLLPNTTEHWINLEYSKEMAQGLL